MRCCGPPIVVILMATVGALVIRSLFRRTLANISATSIAIAGGDFAQRVKLTGRGDEFDQVAEVINDMLDRIGRLMDGVRQVSNAIAHDLRTPITRARTRLEDAALHAESADDLRAAIERATIDLDGIVGVFQALLRIAEIEAGSRRSLFARLDLAPLLAEVAELYGAVAEERGIVLRLEAPDAVPAYGDRAMIQQAIANLVDNAVKFSPDGGTVRLDRHGLGPRCFVAVEDQGPGIPLAEREKATDRFYRGEVRAQHTGVGAWVCRWSLRSRICTAARCGWRTTDPACARSCRFRLPEDGGRHRPRSSPGSDRRLLTALSRLNRTRRGRMWHGRNHVADCVHSPMPACWSPWACSPADFGRAGVRPDAGEPKQSDGNHHAIRRNIVINLLDRVSELVRLAPSARCHARSLT